MMKLINESSWQEKQSVLATDPDPRAQRLLAFVPAWAEAAEDLMLQEEKFNPNEVPVPIEALRRTLREAEAKTGGQPMSALILGQVLMILGNEWEPAAKDMQVFVDSMNPIEENLLREVGLAWIAARQAQAADHGQSD